MRIMLIVLTTVFLAVFSISCTEAQRGSAQALDNLGSVIKSESKKVWIPADGSTDTDTNQADENETQSQNNEGGYYY